MLYRLEVENFFSIRDRQVLDLSIDAKVPDPDGRYAPIFEGADIRAPKVVALYGANASGKTTLLRALQFIVTMIRDSVSLPASAFVGVESFSDLESASRPIRFAIELGSYMDLSPEVVQRASNGEKVELGTLRYELEIEVEGGIPKRIKFEALRQRSEGHGKWRRLYERDKYGAVKGSKAFTISGYRHLEKTLAVNHTVLSSFAKFQHPFASIIVDSTWTAIFHVAPVSASSDREIVEFLHGNPNVLSRLSHELNRIDTGVEKLRIENTANGPKILFRHSGLNSELPWILESHGTRNFVKIFPFLATALDIGSVVAIDEMDAAIHPNLLPELVRWFYGASGRNERNAQLWLSCHSASLLDDLNKEEIVICEKDRQGRSRVYSLMDVKVRRDENHYRKYLSGVYGGVPYLG